MTSTQSFAPRNSGAEFQCQSIFSRVGGQTEFQVNLKLGLTSRKKLGRGG